MVERILGKDEVGGPSPLISSKGNPSQGSLFYFFADFVRCFVLRARATCGGASAPK